MLCGFRPCFIGRSTIIIITLARKWSAWRPRRKMHGSSVLLTTEKDAMNLPDSTVAILDHAGIEVYWLKIGVHLEKEDQLLELIAKASKWNKSSARSHSELRDTR